MLFAWTKPDVQAACISIPASVDLAGGREIGPAGKWQFGYLHLDIRDRIVLLIFEGSPTAAEVASAFVLAET